MTTSHPVHLPSFSVHSFRAIRSLSLPEFGSVNLFVGKNNAGKSSLLEAIQLFSQRNSKLIPAVVLEVVRNHSDYRPPGFTARKAEPEPPDLQAAVESAETLFFGCFDDRPLESVSMFIESTASEQLTIELPWTSYDEPDEEQYAPVRPALIDPDNAFLTITTEQAQIEIPLEWFLRRVAITRVGRRTPALLIPAAGLDSFRARQLWDSIAVSGLEDLVTDAVRSLVPDLEKILLIGESGTRTVLCRLHGVARPVPIRSMGDGVNRVFGLAVGIAHARGGIILIDEVENGLHHTAQRDVWDSIFRLSERLHVQVFATTHSWETVVAFQRAANQSWMKGMLYRLERDFDGHTRAERYTEQEVAIAAEQQIEVR